MVVAAAVVSSAIPPVHDAMWAVLAPDLLSPVVPRACQLLADCHPAAEQVAGLHTHTCVPLHAVDKCSDVCNLLLRQQTSTIALSRPAQVYP